MVIDGGFLGLLYWAIVLVALDTRYPCAIVRSLP